MDGERRRKMAVVFQDTKNFFEENAVLSAAIKYGREHTRFYEADEYPELAPVVEKKRGEVQVIPARTFEAAMSLHRDSLNTKIAVLNFASATNPGGGVITGSSAQEESLCRCSTLYPTLDQKWLWEKYYLVNQAVGDCRHTDACIYSPGVIICKTDEDIPQRMAPEEFVTVDVITCAAPNLRHKPSNWHNPETGKPVKMEPKELYDLHVKRGRHILHIAAANEVDVLILGAFGCGAFENGPFVVAKAYREVIQEYQDRFEAIVFAIDCRSDETENFKAFNRELDHLSGKNEAQR